MHSNKDLQFISNKIAEIQVALFHCPSNSLLKIPSSVVHTLKVNDDGHVLFFLPRPKQLISQFDKDFPVEMNYFRKGVYASLHVFGKARIINDPEELLEYELFPDEITRALSKDVLIVVKVLKADYNNHSVESNMWIQKLKSFVFGLLAWVEPRTKSFDFSKSSLPNYGF